MASAGLTISPNQDSLRFVGSNCYNSTRYAPDSILIFLMIPGSPSIPLRVLKSDSIGSVKLRIQTRKGFFIKKLIHDGRELARKNCQVSEYGLSNGDTLHLIILVSDLKDVHLLVRKSVKVTTFKPPDQVKTKPPLLEPIITNPKIKLPSIIKSLLEVTLNGLENTQPVMASEGSGGVYFIKDKTGQKFLSVFKPMDEEPMAKNNPHGLPVSKTREGLKKGTWVGEGALREVAAYLLNRPSKLGFGGELGFRELGFAGVPPTVMVRCGDKTGSLQKFVRNVGNCEDVGSGLFCVEDVHKIAVLDIRLANADRHAGNILLVEKDGGFGLVPIDHGYCLPESFEDCTFEWLNWPQSHKKFNSETLNYIKSLNAEEDIKLFKYYGWDLSIDSSMVFRISTMLLKKGAERELTPFDIGNLMCRPTLKRRSKIEEIVERARDFAFPESGETGLLESVSEIMDRYLDELCS